MKSKSSRAVPSKPYTCGCLTRIGVYPEVGRPLIPRLLGQKGALLLTLHAICHERVRKRHLLPIDPLRHDRSTPEADKEAVAIRFQDFGFPLPCYPNYGAPDFCPGRLISC